MITRTEVEVAIVQEQNISLPHKLLSVGLIALMLGVVILTGSLVLLQLRIPFPYWLYRTAVDNSMLLCVGILPFGLLAAVIQSTIWRKRGIAVLFVTVSLLLSCAAVPFTAWLVLLTVLGIQTHHDSLSTESHVYHLSSEWKIGVGMASRAGYLLWQCDMTQIVCSVIHSERIPPIYPEEEYRASKAELVRDAQTGEIEFILDGQLIYAFSE